MVQVLQRYKIYIDKGSLNFVDKNAAHAAPSLSFSELMQSPAHKVLQNKIFRKSDVFVLCEDPSADHQNFIQGFAPVFAAGGIVENEDHEILFIQRKRKWDLPKGHVEHEEKTADAAIREVQEECGLKEVDLLDEHPLFVLRHIYFEYDNTPSIKTTAWYAMRASKHALLVPQKEEGITALAWMGFPYTKVLKSKTYSSIIDIVKALAP